MNRGGESDEGFASCFCVPRGQGSVPRGQSVRYTAGVYRTDYPLGTPKADRRTVPVSVELGGVEFIVEAFLGHEGGVGALFHHVALVEDEDQVRVLDG